MAISSDAMPRESSIGPSTCLEDRFELLKEIGDGSFGSVALARVRTAGATVARRGTLIAIKTMKKTFDSFTPCLELREVIFLRTLPTHAHLVPALDIFLDPMTRKLHICMEYMDGNLYQLMKSRDHKCLDSSSVKSILFQILAGLDHIHAHQFFHRDIKPENILVSTSSSAQEANPTFRRYSALMTPPSTPPSYTIKIADFGLARETHSRHPYTTYVSTRWYRAPEVLLRAGEYSAPVDIWALGAMAVEIANLKPLFPGGNEVDQVWRVCEIMGSPGNWYDKNGSKIGGGEWRDGTRLAQKLGFSFPKMAPHSMETILRPPQWPVAFSNFVTWCLMWDPRSRPTSSEAMKHEFFSDAVDPLRPKSATSRLLSRKTMALDTKPNKDSQDAPGLTSSRSSWFRKSIARDPSPILPQPHNNISRPVSPRPPPMHAKTSSIGPSLEVPPASKYRPFASKRATWANGATPPNQAPMPILPSIRPISPFSNTVTAQAHYTPTHGASATSNSEGKPPKKIGRQLSVQSNGNHYADMHRQEAERALNGQRTVVSPSEQKEGFFSHLRKRARRLSGKPQVPAVPAADDIEASVGCSPWQSNRNSVILDPNLNGMDTIIERTYQDTTPALPSGSSQLPSPDMLSSHKNPESKPPARHPSLSKSLSTPSFESASMGHITGPVSARTRRAINRSERKYDTPDEEDELLHEALNNANTAARRMDRRSKDEIDALLKSATKAEYPPRQQPSPIDVPPQNPYPTPSPSARRNGILFDQTIMPEPAGPLHVGKTRPKDIIAHRWPTPPYEENEWASAAAASIFAAGSMHQ